MSAIFPEFQLQGYRLWKLQATDVDLVYAGLSHPDVIAHYGVSYDSLAATAEQMRWYEQILTEHSGIWWVIACCDDDSLAGACGFNDWNHEHHRIDIGYWLLPRYWRQGLLKQALPKILKHAFEHMHVHRIHADVEPDNVASWRLLESLDFTREGTLRDVEYKNGSYLSLHQYSLLKSDTTTAR